MKTETLYNTCLELRQRIMDEESAHISKVNIQQKAIADDKPNGTQEDLKNGFIHIVGGYFVTNEGTKDNPKYHVWVPDITHANCDSAYEDLSLSVSRCNYIAKNKIKIPYITY